MKTTTVGTLEEWLIHDPDAMLINRKLVYMSNGCYITNLTKKENPIQVVYYSIYQPDDYSDYSDPYFLCGSGCPYVIRAKHKLFADVHTIYGSGTFTYPISQNQWNDNNWEKIERIEDCLIKRRN